MYNQTSWYDRVFFLCLSFSKCNVNSFVFFLIRVRLSFFCTQLLLSFTLSGSMSAFCKRWCARANSQWLYDTSMSQNLRFPTLHRPSFACLCCCTTGTFNALKYLLIHLISLQVYSSCLIFINQSVCPPARCLIEAWYLLRQHSNRLNMTELLGFLYESCQELGLIKELLKLPLGLNEQVERWWKHW